jgi:hypothetical protein
MADSLTFGGAGVGRTVVVFDEVDGIGAGDRGGIPAIAALGRAARVPVVMHLRRHRRAPRADRQREHRRRIRAPREGAGRHRAAPSRHLPLGKNCGA